MNRVKEKIDQAFDYLSLANSMDYIGEEVSQLEHALQSAYFAENAGHQPDVIIACLFHDIGHFAAAHTKQHTMANLGVVNHEWLGAKLMHAIGFSAKIALLIGNHVNAKRYLAGKKKKYLHHLSEASRGTLSFQGGMMSEDEMYHFETHPYFKDILRVRMNDEKAKEVGLVVPDFTHYRSYLYEHLKSAIGETEDMLIPDYMDDLWVEQFKNRLEKTSK